MALPSPAKERIAAKVANFKGAVASGKTLLERDMQNRDVRFSKVDASLCNLSEPSAKEIRKNFAEHERQGLLAKCKRWSTDDFETQTVIGEGAFGTVHLVKRKGSDEFYALKAMKKDLYKRKNNRDRAFAERNVLAEAQSRWFVNLHMSFQDADHIFMVMEFLQGGDLVFHLIKMGRFTIDQTTFYMAELLEALDTVHQLGFVHRDVKPDNIVLTRQGHLKLLDFGLAKHALARDEQAPLTKADATLCLQAALPPKNCRRAQLKSTVGTPQYMAPEVWEGSYGPEADIWALGIMTFECLVGHVPFHAGNKEGMQAYRIMAEKIRRFEELLPIFLDKAKGKGLLGKTPSTQNFLTEIIMKKERRLTAQQCRSHPFFFRIDFRNLHLLPPPIVPQCTHLGDTSCFDSFDDDPALKSKAQLPPSPASNSTKKDATLEWCGYEFDRTIQGFQSSDIQVAELGKASASSSRSGYIASI